MMDRHLEERAERAQDRTHPGNGDPPERFTVVPDGPEWHVVDRWDGRTIAKRRDYLAACAMVAELRLRLGR